MNKITYRQVGDYLIPNLEFTEEEKAVQIDAWGMRRKNHLIQNNRALFNIMLAEGTLWAHLAEVDNEAETMLSQLIDDISKAEGVTEELKATDQMAWVGKMNNIRQRATEIVNTEIILA